MSCPKEVKDNPACKYCPIKGQIYSDGEQTYLQIVPSNHNQPLLVNHLEVDGVSALGTKCALGLVHQVILEQPLQPQR